MKKARTQEERYHLMLETPVSRLIPSLAVPTIISMLITAIYNMADTFFVSQIGTSASGAVGVISSLMFMIQAIGFTFGMGSGNYISRSLGNHNGDEADKAAATAFFTVMIIGAAILCGGTLFIEKLVYLLGATDTIAPYAMEYCRYILLATPFMLCSFVMNNILRSQGIALYAMFGIATGGILNMILDPLFIFRLNMGISGAAVATMISQIVSFVILLAQCNLRGESIKIRFRNFAPGLRLYGIILHAGLPSFCRQGLGSISIVILNLAAGPYGDAAIAAMSITSRFMMFINSSLIGFGQGFQPVCGFNFGADKFNRVLEAFWFCVKVAVGMMTIFGIVSMVLSRHIITAFRREDMEVIRMGTTALRLQLLTVPLQAWIIMVNMLIQSIGYGFRASIVSMGRQGLFLIPLLLILPRFIGIAGVQLAQPVSDLLTCVMSTAIVWGVLNELKEKKNMML